MYVSRSERLRDKERKNPMSGRGGGGNPVVQLPCGASSLAGRVETHLDAWCTLNLRSRGLNRPSGSPAEPRSLESGLVTQVEKPTRRTETNGAPASGGPRHRPARQELATQKIPHSRVEVRDCRSI